MCMAGLYWHLAISIDGFFKYAPLRSFLHSMPKKSGHQRLPEDINLNSLRDTCREEERRIWERHNRSPRGYARSQRIPRHTMKSP